MKTEPLPRYSRVKRMIAERIGKGEWKSGDQIPSEADLVRDLSVSRMTINRALRELSLEGLLTRVQGVGTFVAEAKAQSTPFEVRNIADEIVSRGHKHSARVAALATVPAPKEIAAVFDLRAESEVFHSLLVHHENGVPVQFEDRYVDPRRAPDYLAQDFTKITPYVYLMAAAPISEAEHVIEAVLPSNVERRYLKIEANEPCLQLRRTTWSNGKVVSLVRLVYPGSRYRLSGRFKAL